jgi:hypothetical protein
VHAGFGDTEREQAHFALHRCQKHRFARHRP